MKHIVFLIDSLSVVGGTQRVSSTIANGLAQRGYSVTILTQHGQTPVFSLHPNIELYALGEQPVTLRFGFRQAVSALRQWLKHRRPDALILVESKLATLACLASFGLKLRRVAWEHHHFHESLGQRSQTLARRVAAYACQDVVTLTELDAREWRARLPGARARIIAIANPLSFTQPSENAYNSGSRTVLAVGRLTAQKGFDLLLSAWTQVEPQFPDWFLHIVGHGENEQALKDQGAQLGLKHWSLTGPSDRIQEKFSVAGIYALSSRHEGLPMVLMESQAYGVPAVAFNCPTGPADLLGPGGGLLVAPGQVGAFADALRTLMSDPQARQRLSHEAFDNSARYERGRIFDQWQTLLEPERQPTPAGITSSGTGISAQVLTAHIISTRSSSSVNLTLDE